MPFDWAQEQDATRLGHEGPWDMIVPETYGGDGHGWWHFFSTLEGFAGLTACVCFPALRVDHMFDVRRVFETTGLDF
ncbi:hypothetical protein KEC55_08675 [Burkholderia cepacia]|uniref:hypothetical protein n=1 Tax=Burkholderia cepacia TaxID=292 RepID=UPI00249E906D|nr:hypothetical protein [Burkholderia cepacia]WGY66944.1 hypothetical protein KEC55_08675 [Burkholderia cepacia]